MVNFKQFANKINKYKNELANHIFGTLWRFLGCLENLPKSLLTHANK